MYAYLKGINRGYDNALKLSKQHPVVSDVEEAELSFKARYG